MDHEPDSASNDALSQISSAPRLWVAPGHAVYVGPSLKLDTHVGSVACLALGLDGTFKVETAGRKITGVRSALIPPRIPNKITAESQAMAFCYLDPATASADACRAQMKDDNPIATDHQDEDTLLDLAIHGREPELIQAATACPITEPTDPRIVTATRKLHTPEGIETPAETLARQAGVSLSRFLHLFVEQTGTGIRCYRRWARMILAAEVIAQGGDLTRAAADAGFATPSHFSSSFRRMFGLTPTRLMGNGIAIAVR